MVLRRLTNLYTVFQGHRWAQFSKKAMDQQQIASRGSRLIWIDCEMTGLDIKKDQIIEIAMIVTEGDTLAEV